MRVALYARVSTVRQAEKDLSIPDQLRQLRAYCQQNEHDIITEFRENGASATDSNRPQFMAMMDGILGGRLSINAILVLTTSRFYRDALEAGMWKRRLKKSGVRVIAITQETGIPDTPTANLLETIFAAIDEHESQMIGFHTARGMRENARKGYFNGSRPPYGYKVEKTSDERGNPKNILVINEDEAVIVKRIFEMYLKQSWGAVEIAKVLNRDGLPRRYGTKWNQTEVFRVLQNTAYIGKHIFSRYDSRNKVVRPESEWIVVPVPPIVTQEVFDATKALRESKKKEWKSGRIYDGPLILTGLLKCSKCGASMVSSTGKGGKYVYYTCRTYLKQSKSGCSGHRVSVQPFEQHVLDNILSWAFSVDNVKVLVSKMRRIMADRQTPIQNLRNKLTDIEARLTRYYEAFEQGTMNPEDVTDRVKELKIQKSEAEEELDQRTRNSDLPASLYNPAVIERIQQDFRDTLLSSSPQTIKRFLRILIEDIVLDGNKVTVRAKNEGILGFLEQKEPLSTGGVEPVLNSIYKWRPQGDLNPCRRRERAVS